MAKDKSASTKATAKAESKVERKAAKTERKAEKLAKKGGVTKKSGGGGDKKEKKEKRKALAERALNEIEGVSKKEAPEEGEDEEDEEEGEEMDVSGVKDEDDEDDEEGDDEEEEDTKMNGNGVSKKEKVVDEKKSKKQRDSLANRPVGALVPFANPLADEKVAKKVFKCVKKAAAHRTLKRGVKEVVKALRKSPQSQPTSSGTPPIGVVVLAADISPMDVISHIPVLAEDHNIPYIYVTSRAELGIAGMTKRPTSVVMVSRDVAAGKKSDVKKEGGEEDKESWEESFKGLVKVVEREGRHVKV